jgi:hypothetical protein
MLNTINTFSSGSDELKARANIKIPYQPLIKEVANLNYPPSVEDSIILSQEAAKAVKKDVKISIEHQSIFYTPDGNPHTKVSKTEDGVTNTTFTPEVTMESYNTNQRVKINA